MIDPRRLRYFVAVAETLDFGSPATRPPYFVTPAPTSLMDVRRVGAGYRPLLEPSPKMAVLLAWRRDDHNAAVAKFADTLRTRVRLARTTRPRTVS